MKRANFAWLAMLMLSTASVAGAQIPAQPPTAPEGPIAGDPRDAGYAAWRDANLTLAAATQHLVAGRFEAVVQSPGARELARRLGDLAPAIDRCVERFHLSEEQVSTLTARAPWAAFDSLADGPYVVVTLLPTTADPTYCNQSFGEMNALRTAALRFGADPIAPSANNVHAVEVRRGSTVITPVLMGSAAVHKVVLNPPSIAPDGSNAVRLYLRYDDLAPTSGADTLGIEFRIWNGVDTIPWSLRVPQATVSRVWRERRRGVSSVAAPSVHRDSRSVCRRREATSIAPRAPHTTMASMSAVR